MNERRERRSGDGTEETAEREGRRREQSLEEGRTRRRHAPPLHVRSYIVLPGCLRASRALAGLPATVTARGNSRLEKQRGADQETVKT
jgi:hypothetical protein